MSHVGFTACHSLAMVHIGTQADFLAGRRLFLLEVFVLQPDLEQGDFLCGPPGGDAHGQVVGEDPQPGR